MRASPEAKQTIASWGALWRSWGRLGAFLGRIDRILGRLGALLGRLGAVLAASWAVLGRYWGLLGLFGASESRKGEKAKNIQKNDDNERFWLLGALCGSLLEVSWGVLEVSWGVLEASWGLLGRLGGLLGRLGGLLGRLEAKKVANMASTRLPKRSPNRSKIEAKNNQFLNATWDLNF